MSTILLSGVGSLGGWALELLARTPGVDRIVTLKRGPWVGPSLSSLAMIGSVFQGHTKSFEHHQVDLADEEAVVRILSELRPDAILHSATEQSPRRMMHASLDPGVR
jgi:dTDP-4-dehydrorhamnose reductase